MDVLESDGVVLAAFCLLAIAWRFELAWPVRAMRAGEDQARSALEVLHALLFLGALGIVETVESAHEVAGNPTDTLKLDACTNELFLGTGHNDGGL